MCYLQKVLEVALMKRVRALLHLLPGCVRFCLELWVALLSQGRWVHYVWIWPFQDAQKLYPRNPASLAEPGVWG